ncbi:MAG: serine/threonine-protein kinase [Pseudoxanthomonas sp.]
MDNSRLRVSSEPAGGSAAQLMGMRTPPAIAIDLAPTIDPLALDQTVDGDSGDATAGALASTLAAAAAPSASPVVTVGGGRLQAAHRVGRYQILRQVGAGGMGVVFAAYDEELDRKVAVKLLREASHGNSDHRSRSLREAQAMARISHPNVVQIYEVGELTAVAGQVFIAMEFIEGTTLAEWQRQRSWEEVLPLYLAAGQGLVAAHESGLVHRDFKPDEGAAVPNPVPAFRTAAAVSLLQSNSWLRNRLTKKRSGVARTEVRASVQ